jgi:hypothetical protein
MSGPWTESTPWPGSWPFGDPTIVLDLRELRAEVSEDDDGLVLVLTDGDTYVELFGHGGDAEQAAQGADRLAEAAQALATKLRWQDVA